jgi:hypothetical protein
MEKQSTAILGRLKLSMSMILKAKRFSSLKKGVLPVIAATIHCMLFAPTTSVK